MTRQVLIVEDDDPTRAVYREIFSRMQLRIVEAIDGQEAVETLSQYVPDIVVLDLRLPKKSGLEVLAFIYGSPRLVQTRVIIFSAHERLIPHELRRGDQVLLKPVSLQSVREAVLRALSPSALMQ